MSPEVGWPDYYRMTGRCENPACSAERTRPDYGKTCRFYAVEESVSCERVG